MGTLVTNIQSTCIEGAVITAEVKDGGLVLASFTGQIDDPIAFVNQTAADIASEFTGTLELLTFDQEALEGYTLELTAVDNCTGASYTSIYTFNCPVTIPTIVCGTFWFDVDENGIRDEDPVELEEGVEITATFINPDFTLGTVYGPVTTDANGYYEFLGLPAGNYLFSITSFPAGRTNTSPQTSDNEFTIGISTILPVIAEMKTIYNGALNCSDPVDVGITETAPLFYGQNAVLLNVAYNMNNLGGDLDSPVRHYHAWEIMSSTDYSTEWEPLMLAAESQSPFPDPFTVGDGAVNIIENLALIGSYTQAEDQIMLCSAGITGTGALCSEDYANYRGLLLPIGRNTVAGNELLAVTADEASYTAGGDITYRIKLKMPISLTTQNYLIGLVDDFQYEVESGVFSPIEYAQNLEYSEFDLTTSILNAGAVIEDFDQSVLVTRVGSDTGTTNVLEKDDPLEGDYPFWEFEFTHTVPGGTTGDYIITFDLDYTRTYEAVFKGVVNLVNQTGLSDSITVTVPET